VRDSYCDVVTVVFLVVERRVASRSDDVRKFWLQRTNYIPGISRFPVHCIPFPVRNGILFLS